MQACRAAISTVAAYDSFGRRIAMSDQDGNATRYEYDDSRLEPT
jgi:uncharacterized protein RhaS with RHS repeats